MKKLIILVLLAVIMAGCVQREPQRIEHGSYYNILTIDSCEYIRGGGKIVAHKGNCKYCEARRKAELKELGEQLKKK
jgi:hypothetical protein